MNNEITDIKDDIVKEIKAQTMVSVPEDVLQSLIWNAELHFAGMGKPEEAVNRQCRELQRYISAGKPEEEEFSFAEFDNVEFVNFGKRG